MARRRPVPESSYARSQRVRGEYERKKAREAAVAKARAAAQARAAAARHLPPVGFIPPAAAKRPPIRAAPDVGGGTPRSARSQPEITRRGRAPAPPPNRSVVYLPGRAPGEQKSATRARAAARGAAPSKARRRANERIIAANFPEVAQHMGIETRTMRPSGVERTARAPTHEDFKYTPRRNPQVQIAGFSFGPHTRGGANAVRAIGNLGQDAYQAAVGFAPALAHQGMSLGQDLRSLAREGDYSFERSRADIIDPIVEQYSHTYGPAFHGDFVETLRRIEDHPLGPVLDAITILSLGSFALERAGLIAPMARVLRTAEDVTIPMRSSPNPLTRAFVEPVVDRLSELLDQTVARNIRGAKFFTASQRGRRQIARDLETDAARRLAPGHEFRAMTTKLNKRNGEDAAYSIMVRYGDRALEGLDAEIAGRTERMAREDLPDWEPQNQAAQITILNAARRHVENPRPRLVKTVERGRELQDAIEQYKIEAKLLNPETARIRRLEPWRMYADDLPLDHEVKSAVLAQLEERGMSPEHLAVSADMMDAAAKSFGERMGADPLTFFDSMKSVDEPGEGALLQSRPIDPEVARPRAEEIFGMNAKGLPPMIKSPDDIVEYMKGMREAAQLAEEHRHWYQRGALAMLEETGRDVAEADKLAQLAAALSPQKTVVQSIKLALEARRQFAETGEIKIPTFGIENHKAQAILEGKTDVLNTDTARKTQSFYANFLETIDPEKYQRLFGGEQRSTQDLWMAKLFGFPKGKDGKYRLTGRQYDFAEHLTSAVADMMGWEPREVQAALWNFYKENWEEGGAIGRPAQLQKAARESPSGIGESIARVQGTDEPLNVPDVIPDKPVAAREDLLDRLAEAFGSGDDELLAQLHSEAQIYVDRVEKEGTNSVDPELQVALNEIEEYFHSSGENFAHAEVDQSLHDIAAETLHPYDVKGVRGVDLEGLPGNVNVAGRGEVRFHGHSLAQRSAREYMELHGFTYRPPLKYVKVDPERAERIAKWYDEAVDAPDDPAVQRGYEAFARETLNQYKFMERDGIQVEFYPRGPDGKIVDPYPNGPREAVLDVVENKHMYVYPTREGFGAEGGGKTPTHYHVAPKSQRSNIETGGLQDRLTGKGVFLWDNPEDAQIYRDVIGGGDVYGVSGEHELTPDPWWDEARRARWQGPGSSWVAAKGIGPEHVRRLPDDLSAEGKTPHPLLEDSGVRWNGEVVTHNDLFRAVHDYYGHIKEGVGFRADGEENAWRGHSAMYSEAARPAMTAETRGQNSWVNFGPFGDKNRTASTADTVFAEQKATLAPRWVVEDGATDVETPVGAFADAAREELDKAEQDALFEALMLEPDDWGNHTRNILRERGWLLQSGDEGPKGAIRFPGGRAEIYFGPGADLSTVAHELGHYILDMLDKPRRDQIYKWLGVKNELTVKQQERFARAMEGYWFNNRPPTPQLRDAMNEAAKAIGEVYNFQRKPWRGDKNFIARQRMLADLWDPQLGVDEPSARYMPVFAKRKGKTPLVRRTGTSTAKKKIVFKGETGKAYETGSFIHGSDATLEDLARTLRHQQTVVDVEKLTEWAKPFERGYDEKNWEVFNPRGSVPAADVNPLDAVLQLDPRTLDDAMRKENGSLVSELFPESVEGLDTSQLMLLPKWVGDGFRDGRAMPRHQDSTISWLGDQIRLANRIMKTSVLYLKLSYIPNNFIGAGIFANIHQGPHGIIRSARTYRKLSQTNLHKIDVEGGSTASVGLITEKTGLGATAMNKLAEKSGQYSDRYFRRLAVIAEGRRHKITTDEDFTNLFEDAAAGDTQARLTLDQINHTANEAMVRFNQLRPFERDFLSQVVFIYPWIRGATRYGGRLALDHPAKAALIAHYGQAGYDQMELEFGEIAEFLKARGILDLGSAGKGVERVLSPAALTPTGTFGESVAFLFGIGDQRQPVEYLSPVLQGAVAAATGYDAFRGEAIDISPGLEGWADRAKVFTKQATSLPIVNAVRGMINPEDTTLYERDRSDIALQFLGGATAPRKLKLAPARRIGRHERVDEQIGQLNDLRYAVKTLEPSALKTKEWKAVEREAKLRSRVYAATAGKHEPKDKVQAAAPILRKAFPSEAHDLDAAMAEGNYESLWESIKRGLRQDWHAFVQDDLDKLVEEADEQQASRRRRKVR